MYSRFRPLFVIVKRIKTNPNIYNCQPVITSYSYEHYKNYYQRRYYRKFGHEPDKMPLISKVFFTIVTLGFVLPLVNYDA